MSEISEDLDTKIRAQAKNRCGYCLVPQKLVSYKLEIEHLFPKSRGGGNEEENLWLACRQCNLSKGTKTHGFDPLTFKREKIYNLREQVWSEHFAWSKDKTEIIGKTPEFWKLTGIFPPKD